MIFLHKRESQTPTLFAASIDRVNNELDYTDKNSVVVPLWLNCAKSNCKIDDLIPLLKHFVENYDIFMELVKKSSTT